MFFSADTGSANDGSPLSGLRTSLQAAMLVLAACGNFPPAYAVGGMSAEQEAGALFGLEYAAQAPGRPILPGRLSCTEQASGPLMLDGQAQEAWAVGLARCQGRSLVLLKRVLGEAGGQMKWRIEDALLLPPLEPRRDGGSMDGLQVAIPGECALAGRKDTSLVALVRWGKRKRIDWRHGVKQVWTFDTASARIVRLPTRHAVCVRLEH